MVGMSEWKTCTACGEPKHIDEFQLRTVNGRQYPRTRCSPCENRLRAERRTPEAHARQERARQKRRKHQRANDINRASWFLKDSRRTDKRKGLENDLEIEFIEAALAQPCAYCKRDWSEVRMTLDRVDNSMGHLQSNVLTACEPCNLNRGACSYEEWIAFVEQMGPEGLKEVTKRRHRRKRRLVQ